MPLVDGAIVPALFFDTTDILVFARVLANDVQGGLEGQDLADDRPGTWPLLQICYENLADILEDLNVESATYAEAIISLPASAVVVDPNLQSRLGYDGFSVGVGINPTNGFFYEAPTLPPDLLEPLDLWQRPTGQTVRFLEVPQKLGGLEATYGNWLYRQWEYRQNSIYLAGGTTAGVDLRIRYIPSAPDLVQPTGNNPAPVIWFARTGITLAYLVAAEFAEIRNAKNAPMLRTKANAKLQIIANKAAKRSNQAQVRRRGYGFRRTRRNLCL